MRRGARDGKGNEDMAEAAEEAVMARSPSVREMAMKLERWRVELPTAKGEEGVDGMNAIGGGGGEIGNGSEDQEGDETAPDRAVAGHGRG